MLRVPKGIQAQLFYSFGALVVIVCLFFTRLSYDSIQVVEEVIASFLLDTEATMLSQSQRRSQQLSPSYSFYQLVTDKTLLSECSKKSLSHITAVFELRCSDHTVYATPIDLASNDFALLTLDTEELMSLPRYANVIAVFFTVVSLVALLLALLVTWFVATRISRPIQTLTKAVQSKSTEFDLGRKLNRADEIALLAKAFQETYSELNGALTREKDFTRDVSHELRTPITLIKNTVTLNPDAPTYDAWQLVKIANKQLEQTVNVLLALARKENLEFESQRLLPIVESAVISLYQTHSDAHFKVDVNLCKDLTVIGNKHLINLLCQNLVSNGFYHSGQQSMVIYRDGDFLVFENEVAKTPTQSFYQGLGHGQYLVSRIAEAMRWQLQMSCSDTLYSVRIRPQYQFSGLKRSNRS